MNTLPIPLPHRVTIRKRGGVRPWCAECSCGRWGWRSEFHRIALLMAEGHLRRHSGKAA